MFVEQTEERAQRGQRGIFLFPLPVEHLQGNKGRRAGLFQNPDFLLGSKGAELTLVRSALRMQIGKASFLVEIPPVFQRPGRKVAQCAVGSPDGYSTCQLERLSQRNMLAQSVLNLGD
jgi:hypothetical protein